jgi:hypothetical protein
MKSFGTMIKNGLYKFAKLLKLKPNHLYVILGLIVVILLALGLGRRREGFDSMRNANSAIPQIVDNLNAAINNMRWPNDADKNTFKTNVNYFFDKKMRYLVAGGVDLKTYDLNNNNQIFELNPSLLGTKDASGDLVPRYVDDITSPPPTPQFLQEYTLTDIKSSITQAQVDVLRTQITNRINNFSSVDPNGQKDLHDTFTALRTFADELGAFILQNPSVNGAPSFANILGQGTLSFANEGNDRNRYRDISYNYVPIDPSYNTYDTDIERGTYNKQYSDENYRYGDWSGYNNGGGGGYITGGGGYYTTGGMGGGGGYTTGGMGGGGGYTTSPRRTNTSTSSMWGNAGAGSATNPSPSASNLSASARNLRVNPGVGGAGPSGSTMGTGGGISQSNIPPGSEDLYMLKTQVTPPSNPPGGAASDDKNPSPCTSQTCGNPAPVPPCPPCERCPEPAFDCKKVPNYNSASINQYLPQPVLADFSQFGM